MTPGKYADRDAADIRGAIERGSLSLAVQLHRRIFPPHGSAAIRDLDESDLEECMILPVPILSFCSASELREIRVRLALSMCLEIRAERAIIPDERLPWPYEMSPRAVAQNFFASILTQRNVDDWKKVGLVLTAKIINSNDGPCRTCADASREYALVDLPSIPLHNCENLNTAGCRCGLVPAKIKK